MITKSQVRSIRFLAASRGVTLTEVELFSLTKWEADRIIRRLHLASA